MIGYAFCGSFCTFSKSLDVLGGLIAKGFEVQPIMSENAYSTDTRFWNAAEFRERVETLCRRKTIHSVADAEPLGPRVSLDSLVIAPCTGNTLAKLACGITDTAVTMAAKAHLRSDRRLIIALASNDALSANLKNIGTLLSRKQVFFVPMVQDDPEKKPHSLVADFSLLEETLMGAEKGLQIRKIFI